MFLIFSLSKLMHKILKVTEVLYSWFQLTTYALEYQKLFSLISFPDELEKKIVFSDDLCSNTTACLADMKQLRSIFRTHWTRIDGPRILLGLLLFITGIACCLCLDADVMKHPPTNLSLIAAICAIGLGIPGTMLFAGGIFAFFIVIAIVNCLLTFLTLGRNIQLLSSDVFPFVILLLLALLSTSNSFVIQETRVLAFMIQSLLALCLLRLGRGFRNGTFVHLAVAIVLVHAGMWMEVCREESPPESLCRSSQSLGVQSIASLNLPTRGELSAVLGQRLLLAGSIMALCFGLHRYRMQKEGNLLESGGLVGTSLRWLPLLLGLPLFSVWLFDACIADTLSTSTKDAASVGKMALLWVGVVAI